MIELINDIFIMDAVQVLATAGFAAFIVWLITQLSPSTVVKIKLTWAAIRKYEAKLITYVNDPTDAFNRVLSKETSIPADLLAHVLPRVIEAISDAFDEAIGGGDA
jgi:hypothetical protein